MSAVVGLRGLAVGSSKRLTCSTCRLHGVKRAVVLPGRHCLPARAQAQPQVQAPDDVDDCVENVLGFCSIDDTSFYYDENPIMTNEEFDLLKEELLWEGSKVAILSSQELRFLEAQAAYAKGKPIMSDDEFDDMKRLLKLRDSRICSQGPRCSIRSKKMYADATPDYLKMTLLNVPATIVTLLVLYIIDDLSGFEVTKLVELPEPYGIIAVWGLVLPLIYVIATGVTNAVLNDHLILKASCPNCGNTVQTYFGDIFTIAGSRDKNIVDCGNCKAKLNFDARSRTVVCVELPGGIPT